MLISDWSLAQISFEESAYLYGASRSYGYSAMGGGVSFADFNNDGLDDITYATAEGKNLIFLKNIGDRFLQVDLGIEYYYEAKQVIWVDFNNDGDKDLFVTSETGPNGFFQNTGFMKYEDISSSCGIFTENLNTYGASFGDIDNDGDLDLFISNRDVVNKLQRSYLYENINGNFQDITENAGLSLFSDLSFCAAFFDYNNDGWQDIYVANDRYTNPNRLYRNNGDKTFTDVSEQSGAGIYIDAMSTTIGDYNNDGWFDIYVTNTYEGNYHLRNNGDGTFTNVSKALGTTFESYAWGSVFLDADNDADLDLYVSSMLTSSSGFLPAALYENKQGVYAIANGIGMERDDKVSFSNAIGDIDNNGLPDIVVMNSVDNNFLWKNTSSTTNNWLKIKLRGVTSNRDGVGSVIEVSANGKSQFRYVLCGEGYLGQNSFWEFLGLGQAEKVDTIKVKWLSGLEDVITDVSVNRHIVIKEGSGLITSVDNQFTNKATLYPNPSHQNRIEIYSENLLTPQIQVFNNTGQRINANISVVDGRFYLDMERQKNGLYLVNINGSWHKLILER